jgi:hypothetical protein
MSHAVRKHTQNQLWRLEKRVGGHDAKENAAIKAEKGKKYVRKIFRLFILMREIISRRVGTLALDVLC